LIEKVSLIIEEATIMYSKKAALSSHSYIDHAMSLLLANRPYLLRFTGPDDPGFGVGHEITARDCRLLSLARFIRGDTTSVDFHGEAKEMDIVDLECLIMALEVFLGGRILEELSTL
jgi:hypothetical protein